MPGSRIGPTMRPRRQMKHTDLVRLRIWVQDFGERKRRRQGYARIARQGATHGRRRTSWISRSRGLVDLAGRDGAGWPQRREPARTILSLGIYERLLEAAGALASSSQTSCQQCGHPSASNLHWKHVGFFFADEQVTDYATARR